MLAMAILIAGCGSSASSSTRNGESSSLAANDISASASNAGAHARDFESAFTSDDVMDIREDEGIFTFSLNPRGNTPALSQSNRDAIEEARDELELYEASSGFLFVDLATGAGIGYNIDEPIYNASAIKGIYAAYLCEGQVDADLASWTDMCPEDAAYEFLTEEKYPLDDEYEYTLESLVSDAVIHSDNDAYRILRMNFDGAVYEEWLDTAGVDGGDWRFTDWWTTYSAREAAAIWLHIDSYVTSNAASARHLWSLLASTETSFIRNTLNAKHEHNFQIIGKAGWNADGEEPQFNALGDAGVVSQGGKSYLIAVLSSYPGEEDTFYMAEDLIAALWDARSDLA